MHLYIVYYYHWCVDCKSECLMHRLLVFVLCVCCRHFEFSFWIDFWREEHGQNWFIVASKWWERYRFSYDCIQCNFGTGVQRYDINMKKKKKKKMSQYNWIVYDWISCAQLDKMISVQWRYTEKYGFSSSSFSCLYHRVAIVRCVIWSLGIWLLLTLLFYFFFWIR